MPIVQGGNGQPSVAFHSRTLPALVRDRPYMPSQCSARVTADIDCLQPRSAHTLSLKRLEGATMVQAEHVPSFYSVLSRPTAP